MSLFFTDKNDFSNQQTTHSFFKRATFFPGLLIFSRIFTITVPRESISAIIRAKGLFRAAKPIHFQSSFQCQKNYGRTRAHLLARIFYSYDEKPPKFEVLWIARLRAPKVAPTYNFVFNGLFDEFKFRLNVESTLNHFKNSKF